MKKSDGYWEKSLKKTIYTLNTEPKKYKPITDITYPLIKQYAKKIGADFVEITERKFPEWPVTYEKMQVYELGKKDKNDWNIFIDADTLINPDTIDWTCHIPKDTVAHNGSDMANIRWKYDRFFWRDGRNIGSCTWLCIASDWCIELFKPIDDLTPEEAYANIYPVVAEINAGYKPWRLIEDYAMSRNIAKYGLKFTTLLNLQKALGLEWANFFLHLYAIPIEEKIARMREVLHMWGVERNEKVFSVTNPQPIADSSCGVPSFIKSPFATMPISTIPNVGDQKLADIGDGGPHAIND